MKRTIFTSWLVLAISMGFFMGFGFFIAEAQNFKGPDAAAPDNGTLGQIDNLDQYLKLNSGTLVQTVQSPLIFTSATPNAYVTLGSASDRSAVFASAGSQTPPSLASLGVTDPVAVYGYATGGTGGNYGAYGYGTGAGSIGIVATVDGAENIKGVSKAGLFYGPVSIQTDASHTGDLEVGSINSKQIIGQSAVKATDAIGLAGLAMDGGFQGGITVTNSDKYGVYGQSTGSAAGYQSILTVENATGGYVFSDGNGTAFVSVHGETSGTDSHARGVYGYALRGNGVEGIVGGQSTSQAVAGVSRGASGVGVLGRGSAWSGIFEGNVELAQGSFLLIPYGGSGIALRAGGMRTVLGWCSRFCRN